MFPQTRSSWTVILVAVWIAALVLLFARCGNNPNFWFDESGQFWMSRGQIHYELPLTPVGTIQDVLQANRTANMDPGGYTVGLHWWIHLGTSPWWLRSFSFIFFVATMGAFAAISYLWTRNHLFSIAVGLAPAAAPLLTQYALELRPYSMEACGVALSLMLLEYVSRDQSATRYFGLGCTVAVFLTSRYSFICTAAAVGLGVLWQVRSLGRKQKIAAIFAYGLPVLVSCAAIYFITLGHPGSHQKADPGPYVQEFILQGKSIGQQAKIVADGLLSAQGIGALVLVVAYLLFALWRNQASRYRLFTTLTIVVAVINAEFLLLSLIGKYPFCPQARWGITLNTLSLLSWFPVLIMISGAAGLHNKGGARTNLLLVLVCSIAALNHTSTSKLYTTDRIYASLLALGPETLRDKYIFVAAPAQASVRYLYEFGPLKRYAGNIYPENFRFEIPTSLHERQRPFDYLIFPDEIRRGEFSQNP